MAIGTLIERWVLSKEGIGGLILFTVVLAFLLGYNFYRIKSIFSQVKMNKTKITQNNKQINMNENKIGKAKRKRQELNKTMRIIACNSDDLADNPTARNMLQCSDFE